MASSSLFLASMPPDDFEPLRAHLTRVTLDQHQVLCEAGERISKVYFPISAVVSIVVILSTGEMIEAAMAGRDGVIGASAALDSRLSLSRAIVQLGGDAMVCEFDELRKAALARPSLLSLLLRHEQTLYAQAQQSTACMAVHQVEARLCRWLLRSRDLSGSDTLPFTQEFLAEMLGVRRTSVTMTAHTLQSAGMIKYARGKIQILDVDGLRDAACECYEAINGYYERLLHVAPDAPASSR